MSLITDLDPDATLLVAFVSPEIACSTPLTTFAGVAPAREAFTGLKAHRRVWRLRLDATPNLLLQMLQTYAARSISK